MSRTPPKGTKAEAIRNYVRKYPDNTRAKFIEDTGIDVIGSHFYLVRQATLKKMKAEDKAAKRTKSWKETAAEVDPRRPAPPKPIHAISGDVDGEAGDMYIDLHEANDLVLQLRDTEKKMDEYRYRCWKLEGEKFGYVQRLVDENKK